MRIIFLALAFTKMNRENYLYTGLVHEFNDNGHEIVVIAPAYDLEKPGLHMENGIKIIRVPTLKLFRVGLIQKGIANILLPYQYKRAIKKYNIDTDFDLILLPTPPITLYNVAKWLKKKTKAKVYLILRDIFPQNAVDLGMMKKNSPIFSFFRKKEKKLYHIANCIGCMSPGNASYIKEHNPDIDSKKLHQLPNWGNLLPLRTKEETAAIKEREGFKNKFVVIFGGNIGKPQKMENIVELAIACKENKDIVFLILGAGSERAHLEDLLAKKKTTNIQLRKGVPLKEYMELLQMSDVGLISLSEDFTIPNIPSKALGYYNCKKPILASIDTQTDFGQLLEQYQTGLWAKAGNTKELKEKLMILYNDASLRQTMGENGYTYMKKELSNTKTYHRILDQLATL